MLRNRIRGFKLAEDVLDVTTGEVIAEAGTVCTPELADQIQNAAVPAVWISVDDVDHPVKVLSSMMVDIDSWISMSPEEKKNAGINELVYYPGLREILDQNLPDDELALTIRRRAHELIPKHITREDIFASINYNIHLEYGIGSDDDIDHLGNRRIRAVGDGGYQGVLRILAAVPVHGSEQPAG